ncbi:MAG TPA: Tn3 family transposase [Amycolatopsis sp.]|jgi:hypothetical protein|nr:Tn3 family transposase [Amycolatopsis sp.]
MYRFPAAFPVTGCQPGGPGPSGAGDPEAPHGGNDGCLPRWRHRSTRRKSGESLHALKRDLHYAHEGTVCSRHLEQVWCLILVTNAVATWTTEYYGLAVESMRAAGRRTDDEVLAHISPAHSEKINFFGAIDFDIEGELAQLGPAGYRPLRDTLF